MCVHEVFCKNLLRRGRAILKLMEQCYRFPFLPIVRGSILVFSWIFTLTQFYTYWAGVYIKLEQVIRAKNASKNRWYCNRMSMLMNECIYLIILIVSQMNRSFHFVSLPFAIN